MKKFFKKTFSFFKAVIVFPKAVFSFLRRMLNGKIVKFFLLPLFILIALRGCVYEPYIALKVNRLEVEALNWPKDVPQFKIGIISDIHAGNRPLENWRVTRAINRLNAEKPDIVFLLGDFVNGFGMASSMPPEQLAKILSNIKAPLGTFAVLGNHDIGFGSQKLIKPLEKSGVKFLRNDYAAINIGDSKFYVAGINFSFSKYYNFKRLFSKIPQDAPTILLMHSPEIFPALPQEASVVFSGHTHGGQVRLPFVGALTKSHTIYPDNVEYGLLHSPRGVPIYVTSGIGTSGVTARLFCPPQIEIITLK